MARAGKEEMRRTLSATARRPRPAGARSPLLGGDWSQFLRTRRGRGLGRRPLAAGRPGPPLGRAVSRYQLFKRSMKSLPLTPPSRPPMRGLLLPLLSTGGRPGLQEKAAFLRAGRALPRAHAAAGPASSKGAGKSHSMTGKNVARTHQHRVVPRSCPRPPFTGRPPLSRVIRVEGGKYPTAGVLSRAPGRLWVCLRNWASGVSHDPGDGARRAGSVMTPVMAHRGPHWPRSPKSASAPLPLPRTHWMATTSEATTLWEGLSPARPGRRRGRLHSICSRPSFTGRCATGSLC